MTDTVETTDPFADLLGATTFSTKEQAKPVVKWEGPIPASSLKWAEALLVPNPDTKELDKKATVVVPEDRLDKFVASVRAGVESLNSEVSLQGRKLHNKAGEYQGVSLSIGQRRGRKGSES